MKRSKWIGSRSFYRTVLAVAVPVMIQNGITNFVNLLDNIMVGKLSTEAMSGVSIVNQFNFVFYLMLFGAVSAGGIFTAQFFGSGDVKGVRDTFRFKFVICVVSSAVSIVLFALLQDKLIGLFLYDGSADGDLAATLEYGREYLRIMLWGLIPYSISLSYSSTLRETNVAVPPVYASAAGVATNFILNYVLIFGKFGAPALGVRGAAIATVVSRFVELIILIIWTAAHTKRCPFIVGAFRSIRIPRKLAGQIAVRGLPLMINELLWALSVTMRNQCYATRGLDAVAAQNISSTVTNLFNVVFLSIGAAVAVVIGNQLGAGKLYSARRSATRLQVFTMGSAAVMAGALAVVALFFPRIYNTTESVRHLATVMIWIYAAAMPLDASCNSAYFTIRAGGDVLITMLLDSGFMWVLVMPVCFILSRFTDISIYWLFAIGQGMVVFKFLLGIFLIRGGKWAHTLVSKND